MNPELTRTAIYGYPIRDHVPLATPIVVLLSAASVAVHMASNAVNTFLWQHLPPTYPDPSSLGIRPSYIDCAYIVNRILPVHLSSPYLHKDNVKNYLSTSPLRHPI